MNKVSFNSVLGIIGGGQLGRMTAIAASQIGIKCHIFTDKENSPASHVCSLVTVAGYQDTEAMKKFAQSVDVVTFEFENIPHESVKALGEFVEVNPSWDVLHIIQNRLREKDFLKSIDIATTKYKKISSFAEFKQVCKEYNYKCILKELELGYDGKGQHVINKNSDLEAIWQKIESESMILEKFVNFDKEISVVLARGKEGETKPYVPVENIHEKGILDTTIAPAEIAEEIAEEAWKKAVKIAQELNIIGVLAVEFFIKQDGTLLVNELAPRPHNSGHWTIDACITNQFEQFVRAVCGLKLGSTEYHSYAVMKNLIGDDIGQWEDFITDEDYKVHMYGKVKAKKGRKMGHVTKLIVP